MTHNLTAFVWERIHLLQYTQFPWRFLSLIVFAASLVGVYWLINISHRWRLIIVLFFSVLTVLLNVTFFKPEQFYLGMTDEKKLSGTEWTQQQKASILDYLPKTAVEPREEAPPLPKVLYGDASVSSFQKGTNWFESKLTVNKDSVIEFPIFDFPNWQVWANGKITNKNPKNHVGRMEVNLPPGEYAIYGKLSDTLIRSVANVVSLLSLLSLVGVYLYDRHKRIFS